MKRRDFLQLTGISVAGTAFPSWIGCSGKKTLKSRPNMVVFITDDESWLERSIYGWSHIPTPNFDRVAGGGILFTHGYTSAPSCAPSRASLLTGRNFWELEEGAFIQAWIPGKFPLLPDLMEAGGYHVGYTGKGWGPGLVPDSIRSRNPAGKAYNSVKRENQEPGIRDIDYAGNFKAFLDENSAEKPFWFWVGAIEPHTPYGDENYKRLASKYGVKQEDIKVPGFIPDTPGVRRMRGNMLYEVCHADEDLGRIMDILKEHGNIENTLLIVTSDNGTQIPRSKANVYDWGLHEPMAMMWPARIKAGRKVDDFVNFIDLAPTMLEAAGLTIPSDMSGRSLMDIFSSEASGQVDPSRIWTTGGLEWHGEFDPVNRAARMIRDERYQYIVNYGTGSIYGKPTPEKRLPDSEFEQTAHTGSIKDLLEKHADHPKIKPFIPLLTQPRPKEELYDCQEDPWQLNNLAGSPEHASIKEKLKARLEAYQRQTRDPRITGDMEIFKRTRAFVQDRKRRRYQD